MRMSRFDWPDYVVKNSVDLSAVWFDSNAVEMTTAKHCMYLTTFCELLAYQCMSYTVMENLILCKEPIRLFDYYNYDVTNLQELEPA